MAPVAWALKLEGQPTVLLLELAIRTMSLWWGAPTLLFVPRRTTGILHGLLSLELQNSGRKLMQPITLASVSNRSGAAPWKGWRWESAQRLHGPH